LHRGNPQDPKSSWQLRQIYSNERVESWTQLSGIEKSESCIAKSISQKSRGMLFQCRSWTQCYDKSKFWIAKSIFEKSKGLLVSGEPTTPGDIRLCLLGGALA
jgi:hypothetical protein